MKFLLLFFVVYLSCSSEGRVAFEERFDTTVAPDTQKSQELRMECKLRSLQGDPFPSVIVRWQRAVHRFTWDSNGEVMFERNFKQASQSHSYPSSGGLSGDTTTARPSDPFRDAVVISDQYTWDDIVNSFTLDCKRPMPY
ncbi:hypothetical protein O0L34_g17317 [Tuta absoluta]|nr:hypothetical protein O0L34_g17317 [Tuta absoluta]